MTSWKRLINITKKGNGLTNVYPFKNLVISKQQKVKVMSQRSRSCYLCYWIIIVICLSGDHVISDCQMLGAIIELTWLTKWVWTLRWHIGEKCQCGPFRVISRKWRICVNYLGQIAGAENGPTFMACSKWLSASKYCLRLH